MGDALERRDTLEQDEGVGDGEGERDEEGETVGDCEVLLLPVELAPSDARGETLPEVETV